MTIAIIRDPGPTVGPIYGQNVSVVIASNEQGRIEPFAVDSRDAAEELANHLDGNGAINTVLVYHNVGLMNEIAVQRVIHGMRVVKEEDE